MTRIKWLILVAALAGLWGLHSVDKHYAVKAAVTQTEIKMNKASQDKLDLAAEASRKATSALQASSSAAIGKKDDELKTANRKLSVALGELRNRPLRPGPTDKPLVASVSQTCTGAQLFREDSEFLTREAARSDQLIIERDYYYTEYENSRLLLERFKNGNQP